MQPIIMWNSREEDALNNEAGGRVGKACASAGRCRQVA